MFENWQKLVSTRKYFILFLIITILHIVTCCLVFKSLEGAVESGLHAMTKENFNRQLGGQNPNPYILLRTYPFEKCNSIGIDKYKLWQ